MKAYLPGMGNTPIAATPAPPTCSRAWWWAVYFTWPRHTGRPNHGLSELPTVTRTVAVMARCLWTIISQMMMMMDLMSMTSTAMTREFTTTRKTTPSPSHTPSTPSHKIPYGRPMVLISPLLTGSGMKRDWTLQGGLVPGMVTTTPVVPQWFHLLTGS